MRFPCKRAGELLRELAGACAVPRDTTSDFWVLPMSNFAFSCFRGRLFRAFVASERTYPRRRALIMKYASPAPTAAAPPINATPA